MGNRLTEEDDPQQTEPPYGDIFDELFPHYLMMGLNSSNHGIYLYDDYIFSQSFETNAERDRADLEEAKNRIVAYGPAGFLDHLNQKQLINYTDGTFAWTKEGNFFLEEAEWAQNRVSDLVRSFIRPDGANYNLFKIFKQFIWVTLLFFLLFAPACSRDGSGIAGNKLIFTMMLSIIGLTIFELLFEARARYLFTYAPIYVILGVWGMRNAYSFLIRQMVNRKMKKNASLV